MSNLSDLKSRLAIHLEALHHDAEEQPHLACEAAELAAEARSAAKRAKLALEEAKASAQRAVRANPEAFGIDKLTEKAVEVAVTLAPGVLQAERDAIDADEAAGRAEGVANAFEHRRGALKIEVQLWLSNYFGDVSVRAKDMAPAAEAAREKKVVEGLTRRRRLPEDD